MIEPDDDALFVLQQGSDGRWGFTGHHPYPLLSLCSAYIWHMVVKWRPLKDMDYLEQWMDKYRELWFVGSFTQRGEENGEDKGTGTTEGP